jgi:hypothetical protein
MTSLDQNIAVAVRHVDQGRRIVEAQKKRMAKGADGSNSEQLLKTFEASLAIFEEHLTRLLRARDIERRIRAQH